MRQRKSQYTVTSDTCNKCFVSQIHEKAQVKYWLFRRKTETTEKFGWNSFCEDKLWDKSHLWLLELWELEVGIDSCKPTWPCCRQVLWIKSIPVLKTMFWLYTEALSLLGGPAFTFPVSPAVSKIVIILCTQQVVFASLHVGKHSILENHKLSEISNKQMCYKEYAHSCVYWL